MRFFLFLLALLATGTMPAQGYFFGLKGGPSLGIQQWNSIDQDPLIAYHVDAFIESNEEDAEAFSVFAQLGYHVKGSANRNTRFNLNNGGIYNLPTQEFQFRNAVLTLAGKKRLNFRGDFIPFYAFGIRGEYTINTNLQDFQEANTLLNSTFYPTDFYVNRFQYGVYLGGGLEFAMSELVGGAVELSLNPDFSKQYFQPALAGIIDPFRPGQQRTIPERNIRNVTIELSVALRLLRKVEYID